MVKIRVRTRSQSRQGAHEVPQEDQALGPLLEIEEAVSEDDQLAQPTPSSEESEDANSEVSLDSQGEVSETLGEEIEEEIVENNAPTMAEQRGNQITPPRFRDGTDKSVEEYLAQYERVAKANGWDDAKKMVILPCYLEGAALTWFENLEQQQPEEALTWQRVKAGMKEAFQTIARDEQLEYRLRMRMQGEEEPIESYVQDVLNLCIKVDPAMLEGIKIRHILRGLKPSLLEKVMILENDTIAHLMTNIRRVQTARFMAGQRVDQLMGESPRKEVVHQSAATGTSKLETQLENLATEFSRLSMRLLENQVTTTRPRHERTPPTRGERPYPPTRREDEEDRSADHRRGGFRGRGRGGPRQQMGRTADGRVICYRCNKVGHYAVNCTEHQNPGNEGEGR